MENSEQFRLWKEHAERLMIWKERQAQLRKIILSDNTDSPLSLVDKIRLANELDTIFPPPVPRNKIEREREQDCEDIIAIIQSYKNPKIEQRRFLWGPN